MQVKKFEARTMKEAIDLVKAELGPEAIILSAKENIKSFGLMGEPSIEVTAAITEQQWLAKKQAEKKLSTHLKQIYSRQTAKTQKKFIHKATVSAQGEVQVDVSPTYESSSLLSSVPPSVSTQRPTTSRRYIDIDEEEIRAEEKISNVQSRAPADNMSAHQNPALKNGESLAQDPYVTSLQNEIQNLKKMIEQFQKVPQSFVSSYPGADYGLPYEFSAVYKKLIDSGLAEFHVVRILRKANEQLLPEHKKKSAFVEGWVIRYMLDDVQIVEHPLKGRFHVFVGPTGQGKTSTLVKLASHFVLKEKKKVIVLSGDIYKVGASDQLKTYCQILNIPFGIIQSAQHWIDLKPALDIADVILFDTAGTNLKTATELDQLRALLPRAEFVGDKDIVYHYVQSALARDADAFEIADRFKMLEFNDVIFTRLDEAVHQGLIYNFHKKYNVPLHSFGIGSQLPEDYEWASKERVIDMIFNLSKVFKERGLL